MSVITGFLVRRKQGPGEVPPLAPRRREHSSAHMCLPRLPSSEQGAGKTTLINHILRDKHGKKIAVIENEFGEVRLAVMLCCHFALRTARQPTFARSRLALTTAL